jgi:hypothetical protein
VPVELHSELLSLSNIILLVIHKALLDMPFTSEGAIYNKIKYFIGAYQFELLRIFLHYFVVVLRLASL